MSYTAYDYSMNKLQMVVTLLTVDNTFFYSGIVARERRGSIKWARKIFGHDWFKCPIMVLKLTIKKII